MHNVGCEIRMGQFLAKYAVSVTIDRFVDRLTAYAEVQIPNKCLIDCQGIEFTDENSLLKVGDQMSISLGYTENGKLPVLRFLGDITEIKIDDIITFKAEDRVKELKMGEINKTYPVQSRIKSVIEDLLSQVGSDLSVYVNNDIWIGEFLVENETVTSALKRLARQYGLSIFVEGSQLYAIFRHLHSPQRIHVFDFSKNIFAPTDLAFVSKNLVPVKVVVRSEDDLGTLFKAEAGESGGETITIKVHDINDTSVLQVIADEILTYHSYDGYRGDFEGSGMYDVQLGDGIQLIDRERTNRSGKYLVAGVRDKFNQTKGYVQQIAIDLAL